VSDLQRETVPLVRQARVVVEEAATEMVRVSDVLGSAESVSATVDSASRLAYRAFSNPVVKVLAYGTGAGAALRRLVGRSGPDPSAERRAVINEQRPDTGAPAVSAPAPRRRHRRSRYASDPVTRRLMWLGWGPWPGSGATMWARRRLDRLSQMKAGQVAGGWPPWWTAGRGRRPFMCGSRWTAGAARRVGGSSNYATTWRHATSGGERR